MMRLIALLLLVVGALLLRNKLQGIGQDRKGARVPAPKAGRAAEAMLGCAHCGVFVPASEAVQGEGQTFCSEQHRRLHLPHQSPPPRQ